MKKQIVAIVAAALAVSATVAMAGFSIVNSKHDLSSGGTNTYKQGSTEICVYCHTPHAPNQVVPLWNRNDPSFAGYGKYNSTTLTPATQAASFKSDSISTFCMSCHDGVAALGAVKNNGGDNTDVQLGGIAAGTKSVITSRANLMDAAKYTNDHPVGFSYESARAQDLGAISGAAGANSALNDITNKLPLYNGDQMECASCHAVHDKGTSGYFLRKENGGSALCLTCHNK